jgi:hypothetical protein
VEDCFALGALCDAGELLPVDEANVRVAFDDGEHGEREDDPHHSTALVAVHAIALTISEIN